MVMESVYNLSGARAHGLSHRQDSLWEVVCARSHAEYSTASSVNLSSILLATEGPISSPLMMRKLVLVKALVTRLLSEKVPVYGQALIPESVLSPPHYRKVRAAEEKSQLPHNPVRCVFPRFLSTYIALRLRRWDD